MKRCPECGEPPHYHSWCTLCAQLFMTKPEPERPTQREWRGHREAMIIAIRLAFADRLTQQGAATRIGCSGATIHRWKRLLGLPAFKRKSYGRSAHALDH